MAKRGPKPTPTPILKLRGSWRAKNRTQGANLDQKCPRCPQIFITRQLNEEAEIVREAAKAMWDRLTKQLHAAGLFVDKDREMMQMLCDSFGRWYLACRMLDSEGHTASGSTGNDIKSPWIGIRNDMWSQVCKGAAAFGLSPADLAGVRAVEKPTVEDGKKKFFGGVG